MYKSYGFLCGDGWRKLGIGKGTGAAMLDGAYLPELGGFSVALIAVAGIAFASGVQYTVIGLWQRRSTVHLSYASLCVLIAALALGNVYQNDAGNLAYAVAGIRWTISAAVLSFLPFVLFIRGYTGDTTGWRTVLALCAVLLLFFCINLSMPATLFFSEVRAGQAMTLPWGERLYRLNGTVSVWGWLFHAGTYLMFAWALGRAWRQWRRGESMQALLLGICLAIEFAALLWGDIAIDVFGVRSPYLDAFAFLPFVLLMSLSLAAQLRQQTRQLEFVRRRLDIEEQTRRAAEHKLLHLAYQDSLTGLPNRTRLLDHLESVRDEAQAQGGCGALLLIDLDNFKTINDGLGHLVGDRLLEAVADRLLAGAPPQSMLARLGGDEFVLLLGPLSRTLAEAREQAQLLAEQLIVRLAEPVAVDRRMLAVGASVGMAMFPDGEAGVADLLRRADIALYRAKAAGRSMVRLFEAPMQQEADTRLLLERGLREALESDAGQGQLALHFQPQLDRDGRLLGAEALLRWRHPQHGELPPGVFIPLAEETGLIHALGAWVIAEACARLKAWERDSVAFHGRLAINVSAWQLAHPHFAMQLEQQVRAAGIVPGQLTLELTESALLQDFEGTLAMLQRLVGAGFHLALDDFGVGYSSLSYLQRLPLDVIKIDRAFVSGLAPTDTDPLASFIVDVAHRLDIATVAEGVETEAQRQVLVALGCDGLQGYLICRPVDDAGFRRWLAEYERTLPAPSAVGNDAMPVQP
ncbi:EAL domain-containing protein [Rhodanobacter sp. 7MK24]|uniref:putative bifunctional diguanylate cyclase/phosphodiesterase n=1 Tax=Rhodanobacter sp. 7MK24 TaxID=2775922 RepID=UPI001CE0AC59|nr:EAL domain-containing protein [Rhodanobacter sp. 7MK24]